MLSRELTLSFVFACFLKMGLVGTCWNQLASSLLVKHDLSGPPSSKKKVSSNMPKMHRFRLSSACAKYHPILCSPFIHSVVSNDSVSELCRPWSDCSDVQADRGLCCPHMSEDRFLHGVAHLMVKHDKIYLMTASFNRELSVWPWHV